MVGIQYRAPTRKRTDIYLQQYLEMLRQQELEQQATNQKSGGGGGYAGLALTSADIADRLGAFGGTEAATSATSSIGGSSSALTGAGQMSVQPAMNTATINSISNGGAGLSTPVSGYQTIQTTASPGTPNFSVGSPSWAGYGAGAISAGMGINRALKDRNSSSQKQAEAAQAAAAMTVANIYTGGLASGADALTGGKISKGLGTISGKVNKIEDKLSFGLSKKVREKIFHQGTRGRARDNTSKLNSTWGQSGDKKAMDYLAGMREQYNHDPKDKSKQFAGKYSSWDEYKKAGLQADDLTGVLGNLKTYGSQWAGLSQDQRKAVTQANITDGLYNSKKGEVDITDAARAKANLDKILNAKKPQPQTVSRRR